MSYNNLPQYDLPEVDYGNMAATPPRQPGRLRGCFLLSPLGCLLGLCLAGFACACLLVLGPIVGVGTLVAVLMSNRAEYSSVEHIPLESAARISLEIDNPNAKVTIHGGTEQALGIDYKITTYGFSDSDAQNKLDNTTLEVERQANGTYRVYLQEQDVSFSLYDLELSITVPVQLNRVSLNLGDDLYIEDVEADFVIRNSADVFLADVRGSFDVETSSFGNLTFRGTLAPSSQNYFVSDLGYIDATFQGRLNLQYHAQTSTGRLTCPANPSGNTCTGRYGDATAQVSLVTDSGNLDIRVRQDNTP